MVKNMHRVSFSTTQWEHPATSYYDYVAKKIEECYIFKFIPSFVFNITLLQDNGVDYFR